MLKILKLQIGFFKFLRVELKKKRNLTELVKFFRNALYAYGKAMLTEYKNLWLYIDPEYRKQQKQYTQHNQLMTDLKRAIKILRMVDDNMEKRGINRHSRRQFWRDFYSNGMVRKDIFSSIENQLKPR